MREMPNALQLASSGSSPFITLNTSGVAGAACGMPRQSWNIGGESTSPSSIRRGRT